MSAVMYRSFADTMGMKWPREVAYKVFDHAHRARSVTWAEVMQTRREKQARRLEDILRPEQPPIQPCYVWTFYVPGFIYGGWWCYVITLRDQIAVNFRGFDKKLAESIMRAAPLGLLPVAENFDRWMPLLAKHHPRSKTRKDRRKAGRLVGWLQDERIFTISRPFSKHAGGTVSCHTQS